MPSQGSSIRGAGPQDRGLVDELLVRARWTHQHLDWLGPLELLGDSPFLIASRNGLPVACLACPPDPPEISWLRLFAVRSDLSPAGLWDEMWPRAAVEAKAAGARRAAAMPTAGWLAPLLTRQGFSPTNAVVFLEWRQTRPPTAPRIDAIREIQLSDLPAILEVDRRSFPPLWRYSRPVLEEALSQATLGTLLERGGSVVGYQISTSSAFGAHLARLAVVPEFQHQGLGSGMVIDLLRQLKTRGYDHVSVNTQSDNEHSLRLYRRLGFRETGQRYTVYEKTLER